ncbi:unnamed protein product [Phytophthora fragariaefolia]|uniref:Unnamed protein product n=1 Tax=Phytophthora fragariaefolia TaxID=1490495 RepID=A0A9W6YDX3_9STRA|nr:unnamed protein product [Phytophthora fragariaefolia]
MAAEADALVAEMELTRRTQQGTPGLGPQCNCPPASRPQLNPDDPDELSLDVRDPDVALVSDSSEPPVVPMRLNVAWDSDLTEDSGPDDILPDRAPSRLRKADDDTGCGDSGVGIEDGGASADVGPSAQVRRHPLAQAAKRVTDAAAPVDAPRPNAPTAQDGHVPPQVLEAHKSS